MFRLKLIKKPILLKLKTNFSFPPIVLANMQEKTVIPTTDKQIVTPDKNYDGLSKVTVDKIPDEYIIPTGNIEIIENGIYNVREKETANVNIPMLKLGTKNITENGVYKASDDELDGYSEVTVGIKSLFTGHYDRQGLKQIGWTDEEINYYNQKGVQWNESEDEYFKLTQTELAGDDSKNTRFIPKNSTKTIFDNYYKLLAIPQLDTSNVTNMNRMFNNCYSLTRIPQLNTSKVTTMFDMFSYCYSLTTIPQLDTSKVTNMNRMFNACDSLTTIPQLDTSNVTDMTSMFNGCVSLKTIPQLDTSNITNMNNMFYNCYSLKTIPELDTSKAIYMSSMFGGCYSLTRIPQLNTSKVTTTANMFYNCQNLSNIPQLDTSNVTNMTSMFYNCNSSTAIPQLNTSKVTNMSYMFYNCQNLSNIPQLDTSNVTNINSMFYNCSSLSNFGGLENLGQAYLITQSANYSSYKLDLSKSTALTEQSLINILTNLYDIATKGCKTQQVVLGSNNLAKLTSEEGQSALAQATAYGWTIS